jgi:hypothetical protein
VKIMNINMNTYFYYCFNIFDFLEKYSPMKVRL